MRFLLLIIACCLFVTIVSAQKIVSGPTVVTLNSTYTYEARNAVSSYPLVQWAVQSGTVLSTWQTGTSYYANIKWNVQGIGSIQLSAGDQYLGNSSNIYIGTLPPNNMGPIIGPTLSSIGQVCTYKTLLTVSNTWSVVGGTITSRWITGDYSFVNVIWQTGGISYVNIYSSDPDRDDIIGTLLVTVGNDYPPKPNAEWSATYYCNNTLVSRNSAPQGGADYEWHWQTTATGTSTTLGKGYFVSLTTPGPIYLRARLIASPNTWSSESQFLGNIDILNPPPPPLSSTNGDRISNIPMNVLLSVSSVEGVTNYQWYTQSSGGLPLENQSGNIYHPTINSPVTNFYVETINSLCPSLSRKIVTAYLHPEPIILVTNKGLISLNNPVTLSVSNYTYDTYVWLKNNNPIEGATGSIYTTSQPGTYKVTVTKGSSFPVTSSQTILQKTSLSDINMNYVVTNNLQIALQAKDQIDNLTVHENNQSVQYFDGLGRLNQTVVTQASPTKRDIVQTNVYDNLGKESVKYLPLISDEGTGLYKSDPFTSTVYNNGSTDKITDDPKPYAVTVFESGVQDRIIKKGLPGVNWQPDGSSYSLPTDHSIKYAYEYNVANEVLFFTYDVTTELVLASNADNSKRYYSPYQLYANKTKDENQNEVIEFIDKEGKTICKKVQVDMVGSNKVYASTYYIYDDLGNLVIVLSPEASKTFLE